MAGLLEKPLRMKKSKDHMDLAAMRYHQYEMKVSPMPIQSMRGLLLDRIHFVYLKAISALPIEDFWSRHHRGLLKAGYCYGPFNPIFNIIVNSILSSISLSTLSGMTPHSLHQKNSSST
ncbi:unnamed protein product [Miscanthus lutarioriparius]|uniref:PIR2-like helical domain-containing protein n=1 Tax=Miscanthus lutarioriparius TaxID=422564 RepID=A0A811PXA2_9POAL|nr:unnamed protein product [Miscanthus lutarioriparius]